MKHDPFDLLSPDLTPLARLWRVAFLLAILAVVLLDVFVWRP